MSKLFLTVLLLVPPLALGGFPATAQASVFDVFDEVGQAVARVTALRGAIRGIASGATEGAREQLNRFIDEKIDPLLTRIDEITNARVSELGIEARKTVEELEKSCIKIIHTAKTDLSLLTDQFFRNLDASVDAAFLRLESVIDKAICQIAPDGTVVVDLGVFGRARKVRVRRPARTHCYHDRLGAQGDPWSAVFKDWEYFSGELCESELALARINPADPDSIVKMLRAYERVAEQAKQARCVAPDDGSKLEMARKVTEYGKKAIFYRRLTGRQ